MTVRALIPALMLVLPVTVEAQASAISYQGYLTEAGTAAEGVFDFELALYNVGTGGNAIDVNAYDNVAVTGGLFQLAADFTAAPFEAGGSYWVEARVRDGTSTGAYTALLPRQAVNASPYAIAAQAVIAPLDVDGDANVQGALTVAGEIATAGEVRAGRVEADEIWSDGPVDLLGGVAMQRSGDNVALVVGNDGPTQPAVRVVGDVEVGGEVKCESADCVPLASLPTGLYRTKADLYEVSVTELVPGNLGRTIGAKCVGINDLPLSGYCPSPGLELRYTNMKDWTTEGVQAEYMCNYGNPLSGGQNARTVIICIAAP